MMRPRDSYAGAYATMHKVRRTEHSMGGRRCDFIARLFLGALEIVLSSPMHLTLLAFLIRSKVTDS